MRASLSLEECERVWVEDLESAAERAIDIFIQLNAHICGADMSGKTFKKRASPRFMEHRIIGNGTFNAAV